MAHNSEVGKGARSVVSGANEAWQWLTPSGGTKWLSTDPSEARKARDTAGKGLSELEKYKTGVKGRKGDIAGYYDQQEALQGQEYDVRRRGVGLQQERLGLQGQQLAGQESQALTQFLGDAYSFRKQSDVEKATGGLYSSESERETGRKRATMSDMMQGRQEQFGLQQQGLDISGRELGLQGEGIDISQAKSLADLLKSKGVELSGIEDLLYQIETERISYEGV